VGSANDAAAKCCADGLMSEADAEDWYSAGEVLDQINADAGVLRPAGTGRHHDALRLHILNVSNRDLVVAVNLDRSSEFA
jgi:hypothetical protein